MSVQCNLGDTLGILYFHWPISLLLCQHTQQYWQSWAFHYGTERLSSVPLMRNLRPCVHVCVRVSTSVYLCVCVRVCACTRACTIRARACQQRETIWLLQSMRLTLKWIVFTTNDKLLFGPHTVVLCCCPYTLIPCMYSSKTLLFSELLGPVLCHTPNALYWLGVT